MVFRDLVFTAVVSEPLLQELKPADLELFAFTALSRKAVRNTAELFLIRPHRTLSRRFQRLLVRFDTGVNVKGGVTSGISPVTQTRLPASQTHFHSHRAAFTCSHLPLI